MSKILDFTKQVFILSDEMARIKTELQSFITDSLNALPDNPNIQRINAQCFTMSSAFLSLRDFSAEYYDFRRTYRLLGEQVNSKPLEEMIPWLRQSLEQGYFRYANGGKFPEKVNLHPDIVKAVNELLGKVLVKLP